VASWGVEQYGRQNTKCVIILGAKQRVHRRWPDVEFDHAAAAAAIAKNALCLAGQRWLAAATYGKYAYAQRQTFCNFDVTDIISLS